MHLVQRNAESWGETSSAGVHKGRERQGGSGGVWASNVRCGRTRRGRLTQCVVRMITVWPQREHRHIVACGGCARWVRTRCR